MLSQRYPETAVFARSLLIYVEADVFSLVFALYVLVGDRGASIIKQLSYWRAEKLG